MKQRIARFSVWMLVLAGLCACEGGKMQSMSDQELAAKNDSCVQNNPTSPGKVTACENIKKECARRRGEGNFAC